MTDASLTQPCCSLAGSAALLSAMEGRFIVVLHGERDCLNSFMAFNYPGAERFYCTNLSQSQTALGRTGRVLDRCLEAATAKDKPQAVIVLGTCLAEMTNDDFPAVVRRFSRRRGIPALSLRTGGLASGTQGELLDLLYSGLSTLGPRRRKRTGRGVVIVGLPAAGQAELLEILGRLGLDLVGSVPHSGLDAWRRLSEADAAFLVDRGLYPRLEASLHDRGLSVD
ncbi:MAG: nitrogenase component 1, partial [Elusimicrobiota bacterium]